MTALLSAEREALARVIDAPAWEGAMPTTHPQRQRDALLAADRIIAAGWRRSPQPADVGDIRALPYPAPAQTRPARPTALQAAIQQADRELTTLRKLISGREK